MTKIKKKIALQPFFNESLIELNKEIQFSNLMKSISRDIVLNKK